MALPLRLLPTPGCRRDPDPDEHSLYPDWPCSVGTTGANCGAARGGIGLFGKLLARGQAAALRGQCSVPRLNAQFDQRGFIRAQEE